MPILPIQLYGISYGNLKKDIQRIRGRRIAKEKVIGTGGFKGVVDSFRAKRKGIAIHKIKFFHLRNI